VSNTDNDSPRFAITIAGEINLDLILYGLPEEIPLERELLASGFEMTLGSSSAILAHNLAVLGASVGFVTCVGEDALGQIALARLAEGGVDLRALKTRQRNNTGVSVLLSHGRKRRILTYPGTMAEMTCDDLDIEYLARSQHFHLSSLFLQTGLHAGLVELLTELRSRGLTISLDTNDDPSGLWGNGSAGILNKVLPLIDLLLPNEDELLRMTETNSVQAALQKLGAIVPLIVVKCGARGAVVHYDGQSTPVPPLQVTPIDTIGAGDSFNAGFLFAWLSGSAPELAAAAGNVTGALSTLKAGGTESFRDERLRESFLKEHWPILRKV
jgi:sugar/nucleoside kinase (ribokinase family)